jgi:hypothetical protein
LRVTVAQIDDKGLHIRRRVCAKLEPEDVLTLCHQLSQALYTVSGILDMKTNSWPVALSYLLDNVQRLDYFYPL